MSDEWVVYRNGTTGLVHNVLAKTWERWSRLGINDRDTLLARNLTLEQAMAMMKLTR